MIHPQTEEEKSWTFCQQGYPLQCCKWHCLEAKLLTFHNFYISASKELTEELLAIIRVCVTFSLLYSDFSQGDTQAAKQVTYYAFPPARNNAFAIESKASIQWSHSVSAVTSSAESQQTTPAHTQYSNPDEPRLCVKHDRAFWVSAKFTWTARH